MSQTEIPKIMSKQKIIGISGIQGQLGQHLAKFFQENYPEFIIIGTIRHKTSNGVEKIIYDESKVIYELMDLNDQFSIENLFINYKFDYFFNTAANAFVGESWKLGASHLLQNGLGVLYQLEAIKNHSPKTRYINMGTSEEFAVCGKSEPQNENTLISPRSPYGCSKSYSRYICNVYKESFNLYVLQPWTFNFESVLRPDKYLPRKVTKAVARIKNELDTNKKINSLKLGNIYSYRSWQAAEDVARGLWLMLNQTNEPKNYVLSATDTYSVKTFVERAFFHAGIIGNWIGEEEYPLENKFIKDTGEALVEISEEFYRPLDVTYLHGDPSLIKKELGWESKISFEQIVSQMVKNDIENYKE